MKFSIEKLKEINRKRIAIEKLKNVVARWPRVLSFKLVEAFET